MDNLFWKTEQFFDIRILFLEIILPNEASLRGERCFEFEYCTIIIIEMNFSTTILEAQRMINISNNASERFCTRRRSIIPDGFREKDTRS